MEILEFSYYSKEEILNKVNQMDNFINEVFPYYDFDDYNPENIKIMKKTYDKVIEKIKSFSWKNGNDLMLFIKNISFFMKEEINDLDEKISVMLDLINYICVLDNSKNIGSYNLVSIRILMSSLLVNDISITNYRKYLEVFDSLEFFDEVAKNFKSEEDFRNFLVIVFDNISFIEPKDKIKDNIYGLLKEQKEIEENTSIFNNDYSFDNVYNVIYDSMKFFSDNDFKYEERHFNKLEMIHNFIYLLPEDKENFRNCVKSIDENYNALINKIDLILNMIDIFSNRIQNKVITPDFRETKRNRGM